MLTASMFLCFDRYASVTSAEPSLIIRCTVIRLLKTTVHVESLRRCCSALNTSPTPASSECVAMSMCSMYFVFGGAAWQERDLDVSGVVQLFLPTRLGCAGRDGP